jgi:hypothetical protein
VALPPAPAPARARPSRPAPARAPPPLAPQLSARDHFRPTRLPRALAPPAKHGETASMEHRCCQSDMNGASMSFPGKAQARIQVVLQAPEETRGADGVREADGVSGTGRVQTTARRTTGRRQAPSGQMRTYGTGPVVRQPLSGRRRGYCAVRTERSLDDARAVVRSPGQPWSLARTAWGKLHATGRLPRKSSLRASPGRRGHTGSSGPRYTASDLR